MVHRDPVRLVHAHSTAQGVEDTDITHIWDTLVVLFQILQDKQKKSKLALKYMGIIKNSEPPNSTMDNNV